MRFYINYNKEAKNLTFRRGSEVRQGSVPLRVPLKVSTYRDSIRLSIRFRAYLEVVRSGGRGRVAIAITDIRELVTPLRTAHEPPSKDELLSRSGNPPISTGISCKHQFRIGMRPLLCACTAN